MKTHYSINLVIEDGKVIDFVTLENDSLTEVIIEEVDEPIDKEKTLSIIIENLERLM